jgi:hypothetical protein
MTTPKPTSKERNLALKQINLSYHQEQDRLLLRISLADDTEMIMWLTYRMARSLWSLLNKKAALPTSQLLLDEQAPAQAVEQFKQEVQSAETLSKLDFDTEYQHGKEVAIDSIKLVTSLYTIEMERQPTVLVFTCLGGVTVRVNLNQELTVAVCNMLLIASKNASWTLVKANTAAPSLAIMDINTSQVLH